MIVLSLGKSEVIGCVIITMNPFLLSIKKSWDEILEGVQYKIYQKTIKAFEKYTKYYTRFKSVRFDGNMCTVQARKAFENDLYLKYHFRLTVKNHNRQHRKAIKRKGFIKLKFGGLKDGK